MQREEVSPPDGLIKGNELDAESQTDNRRNPPKDQKAYLQVRLGMSPVRRKKKNTGRASARDNASCATERPQQEGIGWLGHLLDSNTIAER